MRGCLCIWRRSTGVSLLGLRRMAWSTPACPMSWRAQAMPRRSTQASSISGNQPARARASAFEYAPRRSWCPSGSASCREPILARRMMSASRAARSWRAEAARGVLCGLARSSARMARASPRALPLVEGVHREDGSPMAQRVMVSRAGWVRARAAQPETTWRSPARRRPGQRGRRGGAGSWRGIAGVSAGAGQQQVQVGRARRRVRGIVPLWKGWRIASGREPGGSAGSARGQMPETMSVLSPSAARMRTRLARAISPPSVMAG